MHQSRCAHSLISLAQAQWTQKLIDLKNEEWTKLQQVQQLAEAGFEERRKMITNAGANAQPREGEELTAAQAQNNHAQLLNELMADMRQLQYSIQAEKTRQQAIYQGKLLIRMQQRKTRILKDADRDQQALVKDALDQQERLLSQQLHRQRFLFSRTKTRQVGSLNNTASRTTRTGGSPYSRSHTPPWRCRDLGTPRSPMEACLHCQRHQCNQLSQMLFLCERLIQLRGQLSLLFPLSPGGAEIFSSVVGCSAEALAGR